MLAAFFPQQQQEIFAREIQSGVSWNRLENYGGNLFLVFAKSFADKLDIVERQGNC